MPIIRSGYAERRRTGGNHAYRQARNAIVANATHCHICRQPFKPSDKIEADHLVPWAHGGSDTIDNLRPAHRSCNLERGAKLL